MELLTIDMPETDPVKNLEYEEGLIERLEDNQIILRFWVNSPSVIIGRFQREEYEVANYAKEKKIPILRRFSGGGTVYHDLGNLNISVVAHKSTFALMGKETGSTICTRLVAESLTSMGIVVEHDEKRNAIFFQGKKILGSAASIKGDIYLFHCSLLVDTDLEELNKTIEAKPNYLDGQGSFVKSVRSTVTKISEIDSRISVENIKGIIFDTLTNKFTISRHRRIVTAD